MGSKVIADSSGLISLAIPQDSNHHHAEKRSDEFTGENQEMIILKEVFAETMNVLGKKVSHQSAVAFAEYITKTPNFLIVDSFPEMVIHALELFSKLAGSVSYTDCLVMACADAYETKVIFGFDEVFFRNGYGLTT